MNPQELLRKIALYVSNGMPADEADRFVAQESGFQYQSVKELSDALGAQRHAQNVADNPLTKPEKVQRFVGGLAQNALQGLTLNHADEMAGVLGMHTKQLLPGRVDPAKAQADYRSAQQRSQAIGDEFNAQHPYLGATAQTAGGLAGMAGAGLLGGPVTATPYIPGLLKTVATAGAYGLGAGAGAAPTVKDIPAYAGAGATNAELIGGAMGVAIPAGAWLGGKTLDVVNMLRGNPATMRALADRQVGAALRQDQADGGGLPILDEMQSQQLNGVVPADAGSTSSALLRQSANREPSVRLPIKDLVRDRQAQVGPNMARALERTRGMTQTEARAGEAQAATAKQAVGDLFDAAEAPLLPANSPAAQVLAEMRSWIKPEVIPGPPSATMSPMEAMVARQNFRMGTGPNPDIVPPAPPPRPFGAARAGRIVDKALRDVGDRPLTVQHARVALLRLKDARQATFEGVTRDKSMGPALDAQIKRLEAALDASGPEIRDLTALYRQQSVASDAFEAGRGTRTAPDPVQAMADRNTMIREGAPETRTRMAQGSTADWTDMLRGSDPRAPGAPFNELANVASPRRDAAGQFDPRRALWKSDFTSQKNVDAMDRAVALQDRMRQTEGDIAGNSTTAAQGHDLGAGTSYQVLRDMVRGGTIKWGFARSFADLLDSYRRMPNKAMARMVAEDMMAPYSEPVRQRLYGLMQMEEQMAERAGMLRGLRLQRAAATGGLLSSNFGQ